MKKLLLAAMLVATAASADAAVSFSFTGAETGGAAVGGTLTIDAQLLSGSNGATPPASDYYFVTGDSTSTVASPFLSVSFTSAGSNPALLTAGDVTYQWLQGDPGDGSLGLEIDYQRDNGDGTLTSSTFTLSGTGLSASLLFGGATLPDFASAGPVYFTARSGTGEQETYDVISSGTISFGAATAVPEASTWAMLVLGFGAVGYARRRTRVAISA